MRSKIGNYRLQYPKRQRTDWRRLAFTEIALLVNLCVSGLFIPLIVVSNSTHTGFWVIVSALLISFCSCVGLFIIRNQPVKESFWVAKLSSLVFEYSIFLVGLYLLITLGFGDLKLIAIGSLVLIYALPFIFETILPRPISKPEFFGVAEPRLKDEIASNQQALNDSWHRCWKGIGALDDGEGLKETLLAAWREPQRQYHTEQHLRECLLLFQEFQHLAEQPHEVELAIWFHDAVYDIKGKDNELKSAEWARTALQAAGVCEESCKSIYELIMATEHTSMDSLDSHDKKLLVDIDLAILGSSPLRFAEYDKQVRAEYSYVPGVIYRRKRKQILKEFLARSPIYKTQELRERFELQARENLGLALR